VKTYPRYKRYDLGKQPAGTVVEVVLSCINNVRLMDDANFQRYTESKSYKCIGGRIEKSPTRFTIPITGQWHVVVDKIGFQILANSNVRAIPPAGSVAASVAAAHNASLSTSVKGETVTDQPRRPDSEAHVVTRILNELNTYKQIANTDVLTGLANRRAFDAKMAQIFKAPQNLAGCALILTDIDHFKSFNDTHGHAIGDAVLKTVADTVRSVLPETAFPARTGGEEFGVILEGVSCEDAIEIAETARQAIETANFIDEPTGTDCGKVTISLGLCMADRARTIADLYHQSDVALYASKKGGRNRCTVFDVSLLETPAAGASNPARGGRQQNRRSAIEIRL
jgi:diguanylate cyclase (GGDEF)-like protein